MTWLITILAVTGAILNGMQMKLGFVFWVVTNGYLAIRNYRLGEFAQAVLWAIYFSISIYGLLTW